MMANLRVLLPLSDKLIVNESANSIMIVAPGRDVRRMLKIVNAINNSSATGSIQVFKLRYADAKQMATEITALFTQSGIPGMPGGMGGGGRMGAFLGAMMMRGGGGMGGQGSGGTPSGTRVSATSDDYSNALIVNAAPDVLAIISNMVDQINVPTTDITEVRIFQLKHADPNEMADQLSQLFPDTSRTDTGTGFAMRFGPGGPFGMRGGGNQATSNDRNKKKSQVIAVPEPRTRSLLVSAASEMMPHIAEMIDKLDSIDARHEVVRVFELANADPQDVQNILQDLFQRSGNIRSANNNSKQSLLGTGNPLTTRSTQTTGMTGSSTGFGSSTGGRSGGMGSGMGF